MTTTYAIVSSTSVSLSALSLCLMLCVIGRSIADHARTMRSEGEKTRREIADLARAIRETK